MKKKVGVKQKMLLLDDIKDMCKCVPKGKTNSLMTEFGLKDYHIVLAFANSKFLVIDEMTHAYQLMEIKPDEFFEFICRIANFANFETE